MSTLGTLIWWSVGGVDLTYDDLEQALAGSGVSRPARPIPVDVFRRLMTTEHRVTDEGGLDLTYAFHEVGSASAKMLTYHLVGTQRVDGVKVKVQRVGEIVFYKPPRGEHSKARIRIVPGSFPDEWAETARDWIGWMRSTYHDGVAGALDGQAVRRIVRGYLASAGSVYVGGPYFHHSERLGGLEALFERLGSDSFWHEVPVPDDEYQRTFLQRALETALGGAHE